VTPFTLNLLLALAWAAVRGDVSATSLVVGFVLGYLVLAFVWRSPRGRRWHYGRRAFQVVGFTLWFAVEVVVASARVAYDIVTPQHVSRPGIVALPLPPGMSDLEITVLAAAISLTPGTLTLDVASDHSVVYVHVMFLAEDDRATEALRTGHLRRVLEVMRG
jgi:multicomponent Na+:H+ antiporter subunit E